VVKEIEKFNIILIINVSIDGPKEINDELRGGKDTYIKSTEAFKALKRLKNIYCYLSCTISEYNINHIEQLLRELKHDVTGFSFSDIHFNLFHHSAHFYKNQDISGLSGVDIAKAKKYFNLAKKGNFIKTFLEDKFIKGFDKYSQGNRFPLPCRALKSSCFIDPCGEIYPCGFYDRSIGNLREYDYDLNMLWNTQKAAVVRKSIEEKACLGCWTPCEAYVGILGSIIKSLTM
jgi:MoaA/NifB/PqqE/SkfB family radical SAM enzyme